jgi:hypothetical protein
MKSRDASNNERQAIDTYIEARWSGLRATWTATLDRVVGYLFTLNAGALAGTLAYVAAKGSSPGVTRALWAFVLGTAAVVIRGALDYYSTERAFVGFRRDVEAFRRNEMEWERVISRDEGRNPRDWIFHALGWVSGCCFFLGIVLGYPALK